MSDIDTSPQPTPDLPAPVPAAEAVAPPAAPAAEPVAPEAAFVEPVAEPTADLPAPKRRGRPPGRPKASDHTTAPSVAALSLVRRPREPADRDGEQKSQRQTFSAIRQALVDGAADDGVASDDLARRVHTAPERTRAIIARLLDQLR